MVAITVETCKNAGVNTIPAENEDFIWIKMKDEQYGLGIKNMCDMLKKEMCGIFNTNGLTKKTKNEICKV